MTLLSTVIRRWRLSSSLSLSLGVAISVGMIVPVIIGITLLAQLRGTQINNELEAELQGKIALLTHSLAAPVWNVDTHQIAALSEAVLLDPRVVRVTIFNPSQKKILNVEHHERRLGKVHLASQNIILAGDVSGIRVVGKVEIEIDDGLMSEKFSHDLESYMGILLGQFVLSLGLVLIALHIRVLRPLAYLRQFSDQLAQGKFDRSISAKRTDEIGLLAQQMDNMRSRLKIAFSEQHAILNNVQVGVIFVHKQTIKLVNRYAEKIFGYAPKTLTNQQLCTVFQTDDEFNTVMKRILDDTILPDTHHEATLLMRRCDNSMFWAYLRCSNLDSTQPDSGKIWVIEDITERKAAEEEINRLAFYDSLTLLPNRRLLLDRLGHALIASSRSGKIGALFLIDLDEFKKINDTLGHDKGDLLLKEVSMRLARCIRESDTVARLGGDEFVVMLESVGNNQQEVALWCEMVGDNISSAFNRPFLLNGREIHTTSSMGVTLFDGLRHSIDELLKQADLAMYQAKAAGRNTLRFFDDAMQAIVNERAELEADLREALRMQQFVLHFQPQVMDNDRVIGAEVLVRWQHPKRGLVPPTQFISLAEETGLIIPLGNWILEAACRQLAIWAKHPDTAQLSIAVNISVRQLHQSEFVAHTLSVLRQTGAKPSLLKLELTESLLVDDIENIISKMAALKALGLGFALDDFGTGYSSLAYLQKLPLDQLKIDKGFVRDVLTNPNDAAIAKMIIALAGTLGLKVVAEGVEIQGQRDFLMREGCYLYQGYYFSRPLPIGEFEAYVRNHMLTGLR